MFMDAKVNLTVYTISALVGYSYKYSFSVIVLLTQFFNLSILLNPYIGQSVDFIYKCHDRIITQRVSDEIYIHILCGSSCVI